MGVFFSLPTWLMYTPCFPWQENWEEGRFMGGKGPTLGPYVKFRYLQDRFKCLQGDFENIQQGFVGWLWSSKENLPRKDRVWLEIVKLTVAEDI